jgi:hypothetical protein
MKGRGERERREEKSKNSNGQKERGANENKKCGRESVAFFSPKLFFFFFLTGTTTTTTQTHTEIMQRSRLTFCLQIFFCSTLRPPFFFSC